jgi:hypothetical protein
MILALPLGTTTVLFCADTIGLDTPVGVSSPPSPADAREP